MHPSFIWLVSSPTTKSSSRVGVLGHYRSAPMPSPPQGLCANLPALLTNAWAKLQDTLALIQFHSMAA
ncbi:MAG: hypothetical protein JSS39_06725 [Nitrospira sp.]|nr:hypothetical protein [Nitrospira sp.]